MQDNISWWKKFDYVLFVAVMLLIVFGILMIASSTRGAIDPELIRRVPDQVTFAIAGVAAMTVFALIDYRLLGSLHRWIYGLMLVLLLLVQFFGVEGDGGAQSWLNLGIRVQPSEIAKTFIIITLAVFLSQNYKELDKFSTLVKSMIHVGIPAALIFIEPDLGNTIVFAVIWSVLVWGAGIRLKHVALLVSVLLLALPLILTQLAPYQLQRITVFLFRDNPDAQYNIDQAIISIGSGGWVGKGYMAGSQTQGRFLRVRHTDFIFSVIAHEFGIIGGMATLGLLGIVIMRILRAARIAADALGSLICYGVAGIIFFQTTVSIGMNLSLMPVTGLTLPFVSSGGTSLLFTMVGIGLVEGVVMRRKRLA